jgi:hypothetical protein
MVIDDLEFTDVAFKGSSVYEVTKGVSKGCRLLRELESVEGSKIQVVWLWETVDVPEP